MTDTAAAQIPVVDLLDLVGDDEAKARAAEALHLGFGDYGLVYVRNHGIDGDALAAFYDDFLALMARPAEDKQAWSGTDIWFQRGWTPPNTEQALIAGGQPDFKECFFAAPIDLDPAAKRIYPEIYADNFWPEGAKRFRDAYLALGATLHEVGARLLEGCALALDLPASVLVDAIEGAPHVTRALRYLPLGDDQVGTKIVWGEEHTDFNLLTLLPGGRFQDPAGAPCERPDPESGLYLRARPDAAHPQGRMVHGTPPEGCIVAQVGQQLEILTGGRLLATPHVIEAPAQPGYTRTAMAHFIHLHSDYRLFPLPLFQTDESIREYGPPVLAGTYALKTLADIGLAPKSVVDKLGYRHYDRLEGMRAAEER